MADTPIWPGSSSFSPGETPFGFYDNDADFQAEADKVAKFCAIRLGYPLMDVELQAQNFYACFEEAITTYGNEVYKYKVIDNYLSLEGYTTGSNLNNALITPNLRGVIRTATQYGLEFGIGADVPMYSGSIVINADTQTYDLKQWALDLGISGSIEIRKVFHQAPPAILRYFDPYAGTGTGIQSLLETFDFGAYSPGINFLLMPAYYDLLKIQAIEFNDMIRRSNYSFEIINNVLKLFPAPTESTLLWFEYFIVDEKYNPVETDAVDLITNTSNVPFTNPVYAQINTIGRQWIYAYTLALAKETLGYVRGKYQTIPIPDSETTLNHSDLIADARTEKERLLELLRDLLDETTRQSQFERKKAETDDMRDTLADIPMLIYVK